MYNQMTKGIFLANNETDKKPTVALVPGFGETSYLNTCPSTFDGSALL